MAALAPNQVGFVGKIGEDTLGAFIDQAIDDSPLLHHHVPHVADEQTGVGHVRVLPDGEYDTVVFAGANRTLGSQDVVSFIDTFPDVGYFVTNLEAPVLWLTDLRESFPEAQVLINLSPINDFVDLALESADLIVLNDDEARAVTGVSPDTSDETLLQALRGVTGADIVVTRGRRGAIALTSSTTVIRVPVEPVDVVTTIGAGDSFFAALCIARAMGVNFEEALHFAARSGGTVAASEDNFITSATAQKLASPF
jgi:ribokinase